MRIHELKCENMFFSEVIAGTKPFEVRANDRGFKVGDILALNEVSDVGDYTGRYCVVEVCNILDCPRFCKAGLVVLGIRPACISIAADQIFSKDCFDPYRVPVLGEV